MEILGIDFGGTAIKGALVDTTKGELLSDRLRVRTPRPSTPEATAGVIARIARHFDWSGPAGLGFPGVVRRGRALTAANVSRKWIGVQADEVLREATGCPFFIANDADVAGLAEIRFGAGKNKAGVVLMLTFGTGIGTALFVDGRLVPNLELGHLEIDGREAEKWASERARIEEKLSWKQWAGRVNVYLDRMHGYLWPETIIVGGGASKKFENFERYLDAPCEIVPARLRNRAGIIGAALLAESRP